MILSRQVESSAQLGRDAAPPDHVSLAECHKLTDAIYPGLNLEREIVATRQQALGEVVPLRDADELIGVAVCHTGAGTEAGSGACYVKFGGVLPGAGAGERFERLLDACGALAAHRGASRLVLGINTACGAAYRRALTRGFRGENQGIAMHRDNRPAYCRPDSYVISDWR
jgi:hypothetical protein